MKKVLSSIFLTTMMSLILIFLIGCAKKATIAQPIVQQLFSSQDKSVWIEINPRFAAAFNYLDSVDLSSLEPGTYQIDSLSVYLIISDGELRSEQDAFLEVHDCYYDLHIPISASENYGYRARNECLQPRAPMDTKKDILFYSDPIATIIKVQPMQFIVFSPDHAHGPMIGSGSIRKAVLKIRK